jgi:CRP-like cAMP-binding protein
MKNAGTTMNCRAAFKAPWRRSGLLAARKPSTMSEALQTLIAQQPFFAGLTDGQIELLASSAIETSFAAGETIFEAGCPANRFFIILEGKVLLESELGEIGSVPIQTLGPSEELGWSWLFPPYYLRFSARALQSTTVIAFYATRLREQCEQDHELGYQLMKRIAEVATKRLQATQRSLIECAGPCRLSHD